MSWSDDDNTTKIVKNAHLLKKFEFNPFDSDEIRGETSERGKNKEKSHFFKELGPPSSTKEVFIPLENNQGIIDKKSDLESNLFQNDLEENQDSPKSESLPPEAIELVRKTREEMAHLKEESCQNCTLMEQEAWEKGFKEGEISGKENGEKKALPLLTQMNTLLKEVAGLKSLLLTQYEREIVDLIFSVSKKIIHYEISLDRRAIQETVLHTLQQTSEKERVVLLLHPEDVALIEKLQKLSKDPTGKLTAVSLHKDTSVSRGGCYLKTPHGDIDATIETRLKKVYESLIQECEKDGTN